MTKVILNKPLNSGEPVAESADGNPEPSFASDCREGATTIPRGSRSKRTEAGAALTGMAEGNDIVSSALKDAAVIRCKRCGLPKNFPDDFYGANRVCKDCIKARVAAWQKTPKGRASHNVANRRWGKTISGRKSKEAYKMTIKGRASERRYAKKFRLLHPDKSRARATLKYYVGRGLITRPSFCERCGKECLVEGHHANYSLPLMVEWLCKGCHRIADAE